MALEIPRKIDSGNIFILIQELLSKQKQDNKQHGKMLTLSIVERQNMQYQKHLDDWAKKSEELKEARAMEFEELKKTLNSKGGWFIGVLVVGLTVGFAFAGAMTAGPGGAMAGAKAGAIIGALIGGTLAGGGILADHLGAGDDKIFFDDEKVFDPLKSKERDIELEKITRESKHIQDKANVKQGEMSRTMQVEMETIQQIETALSNMMVRLIELLGKTNNMMR